MFLRVFLNCIENLKKKKSARMYKERPAEKGKKEDELLVAAF